MTGSTAALICDTGALLDYLVESAGPSALSKRHRPTLNLLDGPDVDELGMAYDFKFLADEEARPADGGPDQWFLVRDVLTLADSGPAIMSELESRRLTGKLPFGVLYQLYRAVRETNSVNAFLEESQDPNKVLDIFVRVNSGGTTLSYSDLLLSMATNQWVERDARKEVRTLVSELNDSPAAFSFSKDLILKAGLVLIHRGVLLYLIECSRNSDHGPSVSVVSNLFR